MMLDIARYW